MLSPQLNPRLAPSALTLCTLLWGAGVVIGSLLLWNHAMAPGLSAAAPATWPAGSQLPRQSGRATLVMFAHPKCPCTRASLRELERLLTHGAGSLDAVVTFALPPGTEPAWARTDSWQTAAAIPAVQVVLDRNGIEADRFRATTSGEALLYDASGRLAFQGGITAARGHEGDSAGHEAILTLTAGRAAPCRQPTFGCPLRSPSPSDSRE